MKITKETVIAIALVLLAAVNQILTACGASPLPLESEALREIVSSVFLAASGIYAWANNRMSSTSYLSTELTKAIKKGNISEEKIKEILAWIESAEAAGEEKEDEECEC